MGTWGPGIFDNDIARDVRAAFEDTVGGGVDIVTATQHVIEQFAEAVGDDDDRPKIYLALATLQVERGAVLSHIRDTALKIIRERQGMEEWVEVDKAYQAEQAQILGELERRLATE